jgi:hypothetical protein
MEENVEVSFSEVEYEIDQVQKAVVKYADINHEARAEFQKTVEGKIVDANDAIRFFNLELKTSDLDSEQKSDYYREVAKQKQILEQLIEDFTRLKNNTSNAPDNRPQVLTSKIGVPGAIAPPKPTLGATSPEEPSPVSRKKKKKLPKVIPQEVQTVIDIHSETNKRLENMVQTGEGTIQVGVESNQKLQEQTQQLQVVERDVQQLGADIDNAKTRLRKFYRALFVDHLVLTIIVILVILFIAAAIVAGIVLGVGFGTGWGHKNAPTPVPARVT